MAVEHLVVIGASAGGLDALMRIAKGLPATLPAAVCIVVHVSPDSPGVLPSILNRAGTLPAEYVYEKRKLEHGRIYIASADHHLLVTPGSVRPGRGPKEHRFRPAVDPLFRSAAQVYGPRVIGIVLSGSLDDGTSGLWAIKQLGGIAIVQEPAEADFPSMPANAAAHVAVDYRLPVAEIAPTLIRLTSTPVHDRALPAPAAQPSLTRDERIEVEVRIAAGEQARDAGIERLGPASGFACPECHGVLLEIHEGDRHRFRCHTGHAYSAASLTSALREEIDRSLWIGIRTLDEAGRILTHLSTHRTDAEGDAEDLARHAKEALEDAETLRAMAGRRGRTGEE